MEQEPDYRSWSTVTTDGDAAWPHGTWQPASAVTDAVDTELAELRRRVVDPVVASVLTADELESVVVFEERYYHEVRATVVARGEASYHYLQMQRSLPATEEELADRAAQFASELEDFLAESGFAWGSNESPNTRFRQRDQVDQPAACSGGHRPGRAAQRRSLESRYPIG